MPFMTLDVPEGINKLLRKYAIDSGNGNREKATIHILKQFLEEFYGEPKRN